MKLILFYICDNLDSVKYVLIRLDIVKNLRYVWEMVNDGWEYVMKSMKTKCHGGSILEYFLFLLMEISDILNFKIFKFIYFLQRNL